MAKVVCVLYDDPVDGYPTTHPRDDLPPLDGNPTDSHCRHRRRSTCHGAHLCKLGCKRRELVSTALFISVNQPERPERVNRTPTKRLRGWRRRVFNQG